MTNHLSKNHLDIVVSTNKDQEITGIYRKKTETVFRCYDTTMTVDISPLNDNNMITQHRKK